MLHASFNVDQDSVSIAMTNGFMCFSVEPFAMQVTRQIEGGLNFIQMLNRTNISVVVGTGENPKYPVNKLYFWDDKLLRPVGEINLKEKILNA